MPALAWRSPKIQGSGIEKGKDPLIGNARRLTVHLLMALS